MKKNIILTICMLLLCMSHALADEHVADASADTPAAGSESKVKKVPVPQVIGARYIHNLTEENFDTFVSKQPTVVLIAARWCPHCKTYLPDFNMLAYHISEEKHYAGEKFAIALYYTRDGNQKDPVMKKFDLDAVPRILVIKDNRYWVYSDQRRSLDVVTGYINSLDYNKAKLYPTYVPDFVDDVRRFFREIKNSVELTIAENPEKVGHFKLFAIIVAGIFVLLTVLAMLSDKSEPAKEAKKEQEAKKDK